MKVIIPENINEVTLTQYQQYDKLINRTDLNDRDIVYRTVKIFTGLPFKTIEAMRYADLIMWIYLFEYYLVKSILIYQSITNQLMTCIN